MAVKLHQIIFNVLVILDEFLLKNPTKTVFFNTIP